MVGTALLALMCALLGVGVLLYIRFSKKPRFLMTTVFTALLFSVALYGQFLFGEADYLYTTIDGFSQYLPKYMEYVNAFRSGELPWWSFSVGFGIVQSYDVLLYPLNLIPVLAGVVGGESALISAFAWMQILKIVLAAFFMFLFLRKLGMGEFVSYCFAIVYAFCGIMILRGNWVFLADECYIAVFILWAAECLFREGKWYYIPPAIFLLCTCLGAYYVYLYALLLILYTTVRYIYAGKSIKSYFGYLLTCGGLFATGVLVWAVVLIGFSWTMFATARFSSTSESVSFAGMLSFVNWDVLISAIFSVFDPNVTGVYDQYTGVLNYLERPLFYCGIGSLFLIPQGLIWGEKRTKKLILVGLAAAALYMLVPTVADVFNAFIRNEELQLRSYRLSTLWIVIMMVTMAAYGLQCGLKYGKFPSIYVLTTAVVFITVFLFFVMDAERYQLVLHGGVIRWCIMFLIGWMLLLMLPEAMEGQAGNVRSWMALLLCVMVFEMTHSAKLTIDQSVFAANYFKDRMEADKNGYYGDMVDAVEWVKEYDDGLYRVAGLRMDTGAATFCSPQYFGVFDSSYYTTIDTGTFDLLGEVYPETFINDIGSKYSIGVGGNLQLGTLTGYKYLFVNNENRYKAPFGYTKVGTAGNVDILVNERALSFGVSYDRYISETLFRSYTDEEQRNLLLSYVVLEDDAKTTLEAVTKAEADKLLKQHTKDTKGMYLQAAQQRQQEMLSVSQWKSDEIYGTITVSEDRILSFSIANVAGWHVFVDGEEREIVPTNLGFFGVELEAGSHDIALRYEPPTLMIGVGVSACALVVYALLLIFRKRLVVKPLQEKN